MVVYIRKIILIIPNPAIVAVALSWHNETTRILIKIRVSLMCYGIGDVDVVFWAMNEKVAVYGIIGVK